MADEAASAEAAKEEIAREIARVHADSYGEPATNVQVSLHPGFVAVLMDVRLSRAEETLLDAGHSDSVRETRETFQVAIAPIFSAIVERAIGRRVESFASSTIVEGSRPWSVEVFRLGTSA